MGTVADLFFAMTRVCFYVPNLIGYARFALAAVALGSALCDHRVFFAAYFLSVVLDAFDGWAARRLNQSSQFGAVLDMTCDRVATACLSIVIAYVYHPSTALLQLMMALVALDFTSHYAQMFSSLSRGFRSHKDVPVQTGVWQLLHIYYTNRKVMGALCFGNESWFVLVYLQRYWSGPSLFDLSNSLLADVPYMGSRLSLVELLLLAMTPLFIAKQFMNVLQLCAAMRELAHADEAKRAADESKRGGAAVAPSPSNATKSSPAR